MPDIKISDLTAAGSATGAMQLEVNDSGTSRRITVDQIKAYVVPAGSINATALGTDAVTTIKIQNGAVTTAKLADGSVTPGKLSTGGLTWDSSGNVGIKTASVTSFGGGLTVFDAPTTGVRNIGNATWSFAARALGNAQSQEAGFTFFPTFENTADNGPRRAADIWAGYNGGAWGYEYLAFGVANGGDAQNLTTERMRIDGFGNVLIGRSTLPTNQGLLNVNGNISWGTTGTGRIYSDSNWGCLIQSSQASPAAADFLFLASGGAERMRVGTAGQISLGATANYGTAGQVLTSGGASAAPSWATPAAGGFSNMQVFDASGIFTVPAGVTKVKVTVVGGGGGATGDGSTSAAHNGAGGGGGGAAIEIISGLTPLSTISVTVGTGGGGVAGNTAGTGGTSSFGAFCSATGGTGASANSVGANAVNGIGGIGSGGQINLRGESPDGALGGASMISFATQKAASSNNPAQSINGAGGTGAFASSIGQATGGAGGNGIVIVEW